MDEKLKQELKAMYEMFLKRMGEIALIYLAMIFAVAFTVPWATTFERGALVAIAPTVVVCLVWWGRYRSSSRR